MLSLEDNLLSNFNQILLFLIGGKTESAMELFVKTEPELLKRTDCDDLILNFRKFIRQYQEGAVFLEALANGDLDINPPDDPLRENFIISQYKQLHSNLQHLAWQTQQIAKGDLKQKVSFLGEFSIAFNKMIEALQEKKLLEEKNKIQFEQLQQLNAEKDKFFSIIAHDLRGPLGGFMGLTELMTDDSQVFTPDERKELSINLSHSARNIFNLLENLLEWSQMQRGNTAFKPQMLDLTEVVTECIKIAAESARNKAIEIVVDIPFNLSVFADTNMLQTVIRNLVSNAIKFTRQGGQVTISAGPGENNKVVVEVKDSGIGMNNETLSKLFRLDAVSSRPGTEGEHSTGLGLLLCKEFVEKHDGKIWVESEQGKGSIFYFTLGMSNWK